MRKTCNKLIAIILLVCVMVTTGITCSFAATEMNSDTVELAKEQRLSTYIQNIANRWESSRAICAVKTIYDFAGNEYTLFECYPKGYIIYNNDAALVIELAEDSVSPYYGISEGLFYSGPTHYYYYDTSTNTYLHTITGNCIGTEQVLEKAAVCENAQTVFMQKMDADVKAYVEGNPQVRDVFVSTTSSAYTYVGGNRDFFENMDLASEMSYWSIGNGACGYVASSIVLLYYHNFHNSNIIDTNQFPLTNTLTGYYFTGPLFTSRLYNDIGVGELAYGSAINASQAADVISTYLSTRGYSVDMWVGNMPRKSKIVQQLEQGHPVIYVDQFDNPAGGDAVDHDIVIYGYDDENNLIAHFGWEGYAHVQATSDALAAFISSACAISSW